MSSSVLLQKAEELISEAKEALKNDHTDESLQKADQALEFALKDACLVNGCNENTVQDDKLFNKWGIPQYINYLDTKKLLFKREKSDFFQFHNWRNPTQHSGMLIHPKQVKQVIDKVESYLEKRRYDYTIAFQFPEVELPEPDLVKEKDDVAPIFRATPNLIIPGSKLVSGEKYLTGGLKHIDLLLTDSQKHDVYVEIKYSSFSQTQVDTYMQIIDSMNQNARIIWVVPDDIDVQLPSRIELVKYKKSEVLELIRIRRIAQQIIQKIIYLLSKPFTPNPSIMYQISYAFPNIMSACYFSGTLESDKGSIKIGLRKQAVGRYFDIIYSLCQSHYANEIPELLLLFIQEVLVSPYFIETSEKIGRVIEKGFAKDMAGRRKDSLYKGESQITEGIYLLTSTFTNQNKDTIFSFYKGPENNDLLYRIINTLPQNVFEMGDKIIVKKLIEYLIYDIGLKQTDPIPQIYHNLVNKNIRNEVQRGYETDMARRIIEIAVLKWELFCVSGVGIIQVLKKEMFREKLQYVRARCQQFKINRNTDRILRFME